MIGTFLPRVIAGMAAVVSTAGLASAQVPVGSFDGAVKVTTRYDVTAAMADCMLVRDHGNAGNLVMVPGNDWGRAYRKVSVTLENCMKTDGSVTMSAPELRGILAERLLIDRDRLLLRQAAAMASSPAARVATVEREHWQDPVFDCVARSEPAKAAALFGHAVATPGEAAAFRSLIPTLQACTPLGAGFKMKPGEVRPRVAISLYRQLVATSGGATL